MRVEEKMVAVWCGVRREDVWADREEDARMQAVVRSG
jgi:lambda repressor-like predicted transcriptional regulator